MAFCYNKLWKLLIDKGIQKKELCARTGVGASTLGKMAHGLNVTTDNLSKICKVLECDVGDIMEYVPDDPD